MIKFDEKILGDLTNYTLVILGILITIFTVIYSFIINKKEELLRINDEMQVVQNPKTIQKSMFTIKFLKRFTKWNYHLFILSVICFISFILSFVTSHFIDCSYLKNILYDIVLLLSFLIFIYTVIIFIIMFLDFKRTTKL